MSRSARKARKAARAAGNAVVEVTAAPPAVGDWSAVPEIDPEKLATGLYKFSGPEESRSQERISHRELGYVTISMRLPGGAWIPVKLWDFTSISFGILYTPDATAWPAPLGLEATLAPHERIAPAHPALPELKVSDEVELRVRVSDREEFEAWCQVRNVAPGQAGTRIGLRRLDLNFPRAVPLERRSGARLPLAPTLALKARVKHPFLYGHWCPLLVTDVNRDMGFSFSCSDPAILLFEGMELRVHFEIAAWRGSPMTARVSWVHATEADEVRFGASCVDMELGLHDGICDFLLHSRQWTPGRLREAGFQAKRVKGNLRFRSVRTMEDYAQVLYLRRDAYVEAGKKAKGTRPEQMAGNLDGRSRILMAHHGDHLVGSVTFTFPTDEEAVLDSQAGFPGRRYPVRIPPKANLIEVSRLCIDAEYRSTDVLQGLFEHGIKHFLMSDRHWLLTSAVADLLPLYERIGFKKLGASYRHPGLNNQEHFLILAHRSSFLYGAGMNPLVWIGLFGDVVAHLLRRKLLPAGAAARLRVATLLSLRPLAKRLTEGAARRAFRMHLSALRRSNALPADADAREAA